MRIEHIKIENWRSIIELEINFQELMILIGQNNHGKSNILSAVLFFRSNKANRAINFVNDESFILAESFQKKIEKIYR